MKNLALDVWTTALRPFLKVLCFLERKIYKHDTIRNFEVRGHERQISGFNLHYLTFVRYLSPLSSFRPQNLVSFDAQ
jgi:hypothetical protein